MNAMSKVTLIGNKYSHCTTTKEEQTHNKYIYHIYLESIPSLKES